MIMDDSEIASLAALLDKAAVGMPVSGDMYDRLAIALNELANLKVLQSQEVRNRCWTTDECAEVDVALAQCGLHGGDGPINQRVLKLCDMFKKRQALVNEKPRTGGDGQVGGKHYRGDVDPWALIKCMKSSGHSFVDYARGDAIAYIFRKKGDLKQMQEDLQKAVHYASEAIKVIQEERQNEIPF